MIAVDNVEGNEDNQSAINSFRAGRVISKRESNYSINSGKTNSMLD